MPNQKRNWKTEWRSATSTNKEALFAIKNGERISINTSVWWIKIIIDIINTFKYIYKVKIYSIWLMGGLILSSPERKVYVSFLDHMFSVVCLSVCSFVHMSVNFLHFDLILLFNHWASINQTLYLGFLQKGDYYCLNKVLNP